uniref:Geranylgeranyl transferase type-2 subunit alpha n=1 Tax=Culicoides sonorensis TaxID=179676 RepID=A0A336M0Z2_CULSO
MHGRLKVRTTEEEQIRKKKEQEIKVKAYRLGMAKIFKKRQNNELDMELYELTSRILSSNPDVTSLWNIRRECILLLVSKKKENKSLFEKDLSFTEQCLRVNPKSYGAWHHRVWVLETSNSPDWKKEVALCTQYLKLDERNFHCWDYRRYVVEKAGISAEKELEFCTEKIETNFSNYSSWHYRSKLLPQLYSHPTDASRPISEERLKEELVLVLNAAFTEPNDSSAWFYQRWLLGYSQEEFDIAVFKMTKDQILIAFSRPIDLNACGYFHDSTFETILNQRRWMPGTEGAKYDTIWMLRHNVDVSNTADFELEYVTEEGKSCKMHICRTINSLVGIKIPKFGYDFQSAVIDILKSQLHDCNELLELEPDSKWTLLTSALLMRAINRTDKEYHQKSLENLHKLQKIDSLRAGYYKDLATKWNIEMQLEKWIRGGNLSNTLNLSKLNLTTLYYTQYLSVVEDINLSGNQLTDRNLQKLSALKSCVKINLADNKIETLNNFPKLAALKQVILTGNAIPEKDEAEFQAKFLTSEEPESSTDSK